MNRTSFELLILGTSAAIPTSERNQSSQLLNICERYFLIDCGEATQVQMRKFKTKLQSIDHVFISHLHGDHFFGLPGLLSSMHLLGRKNPINVYCPEPLKEFIDLSAKISFTEFSYKINWVFAKDKGLNLLFEDDKVEVFSFPLKHRIFCTGFLFKEKPLGRKIDKAKMDKYGLSTADIHALRSGGDVKNKEGKKIKNSLVTNDPPLPRSYAYCSDTVFTPAIAKYFKGVDVLYHESTFLDDNLERAKKTFHTTARQAAEIAKLCGAGKLLLGHFSTRYPKLDEFEVQAKTVFENSEICVDGKKVKI
jgi:ribonuclease Z